MKDVLSCVLSAVFLLSIPVGCGDDGSALDASTDAGLLHDGFGGEVSSPPFSVWEKMRGALKTSPDHLRSRADAIVAKGDPAAILAFVQTAIALVGTDKGGFSHSAITTARWKSPSVLRYGVGTPREKAEVLAWLYERAGFQAEIVAGKLTPGALAALKAEVTTARPPRFSLTVGQKTFEVWAKELGGALPVGSLRAVDAKGALSQALAKKLLALFPKPPEAKAWDWSGLDAIPLVRVTVDKTPRLANPLVAGAVLGDGRLEGDAHGAAAISWQAKEVKVALRGVFSHAMDREVTFVEGSWPTRDLFGRQVVMKLLPVADLEMMSVTRASDLRSFVPVLAVQAPGLDKEALAALAVKGDVITLGGETIHVDEGGQVSVDGVPMTKVASGAGAEKVASVEVKIDPVMFPRIEVKAWIRDSAKADLNGLGAGDLVLEEDGERRPFVLRHNAPTPPRVLIILDSSNSIPVAFREQGVIDFTRDLATAVLKKEPKAQFLVSAMGLGLKTKGAWTASPDEVAKQAKDTVGSGSDLWEAISQIGKYKPTVVIFVTDAQATDKATETIKLGLAHGPPVVMVGVGQVESTILNEVATLSRGQAVKVSDHQGAVDAVTAFLGASSGEPYALTYQAPAKGGVTRIVKLTVKAKSVRGTGSYTVPGKSERLVERHLAGLYLAITIGGETVVRTLAGVERGSKAAPDEAVFREVHAAALGTAMVAFEGASPLASAWLDDVLSAKLGLKALWAAVRAGDADAIGKSFGVGLATLPSALRDLTLPLAGSSYRVGPEVIIYSEFPRFDGPLTQKVDMLPFFRVASFETDRASRFAATLAASARPVVIEGALFDRSTVSALADKEWVLLTPYVSIETEVAGLSALSREAWGRLLRPYERWYRVVPKAGTPRAAYAIDPDTGTLLAILGDGSGGGEKEDIQRRIAEGSKLLDILGLLGSLGGAGFALGGVVALAKAILKTILLEALAVATLDATGFGDAMRKVGGDLACDMAKAGAGGVSSDFSHANDLDTFVQIAGGQSFLPCP